MSTDCAELHRICNGRRRFSYPFDEGLIPANGIYIQFERGERAHGADRIVRVGSHTGSDQLPSRLAEHFERENKDRSIFRKHIGRAFLNLAADPFLRQWDRDRTPAAARRECSNMIDLDRFQAIERRVTAYIQKNVTFIVFEVPDRTRRLELESRLISTVSRCKECEPSADWLGMRSPKTRIRESGLWQIQKLYKTPLTPRDIDYLGGLL